MKHCSCSIHSKIYYSNTSVYANPHTQGMFPYHASFFANLHLEKMPLEAKKRMKMDRQMMIGDFFKSMPKSDSC